MTISIIIPTFNEASNIQRLISYLKNNTNPKHIREIIVIDGGSTDATVVFAKAMKVRVKVAEQKGRAAQMNEGTKMATGDIFYFLHADSFPPENFTTDILAAVEKGFESGCYRLQFDHPHKWLQLMCWFTHFNFSCFRFGDQSLFISRELFEKMGGYNSKMLLLEDQDLICRMRKKARFKLIKRNILTSPRKYLQNGFYRLQGIYFLLYFLYSIGIPHQKLVQLYRRNISNGKI